MRSCLLAISVSAALLMPVAPSFAQIAGSGAEDTATTMFDVAGVKVIHRRLTTSEIVVAQIYLLGGSRQLTFDNAGIEQVMLDASEYGTGKYPGRQARLALAATGSSITVNVTKDWSVLELRTIRSELDSAWSVFADRIAAPELSATAFGIARDRNFVAAQFRKSDPDGLLQAIADSVAFAGHPYAIEPSGTESSLRKLTASDIVNYHLGQTVASRMLVVIVGNVTAADVQRLVIETLGMVPRGKYTWTLPSELIRRRSALVGIQRPFKTNYLLGYFPGPPVGSRQHPAFRVATALLGGMLSYRIREERQLSYAAYAPFLDRAVAAGGVYVSTHSPGEVLPLVYDAVANMTDNTLQWDQIPRLVSQFKIDFLLDQETYDGQATELARAHLLRGDYRLSNAWLKDLKRVSPITMQSMARWYFNNIQYVYLGDTEAIKKAIRE